MKKENKIKSFFKRHKKGIYITAGIIGGSVLCFFGIKCYLKQPTLEKFLKESSLSLLKEKRNEIHTEYLKYTKNDEYRNSLWNLLPILDKEISKREWDGKIPSGPAYHREHGYNLYKPD
ncbi:MAG: hypothetical protein IJE00_06640 [Clostridia bacterium]|nr:hypothetical protein [Clostridia bacterium]MBQ2940031.1 hypothetical protein [Clostridia bacterium]